MIETSLRTFASSELITSKLNQIIEAFVTFYGEDCRAEIEERFHNTQILKFASPQTIKHNIRNVKASILKEVYNIAENKISDFEIESLIKFLENKDTVAFKYIPKDILKIIFDDDYFVSADEIYEKFTQGQYPKLNEFVETYQKIKPILDQYEKKVDEEETKASEIRTKYYKQLITEFSYLISDEDMKCYEQFGISHNTMQAYFEWSINDNGHCFDDQHEALINDQTIPKYKKDAIILDRLRFLKVFGYQYESYEECLQDEGCTAFIEKSRQICQKIAERKSTLYRLQEIEVVESYEDYQKCRQAIRERNYVNKNDSLGTFTYNSYGVSCCEVNYTLNGSEMIMSPLVLINSGISEFDCTIIHELNHAYEYYTTELGADYCHFYCGWDYDTVVFKQKQNNSQLIYTGISRSHELLSEYVNDRIAQEITDIMHNQGNYILATTSNKNSSSYMTVKYLAEPFYQEFKDVIIASRRNGNIGYLYDMVGRDNFEALNDLVNDYNKKFRFGISGQLAFIDYYKNVHDEYTETIKELITRRDQIMANMLKHFDEIQSSKVTR